MAWHGVESLLQKAERSAAGTPFQSPLAIVNVLIELGNSVIGRKEALEELVCEYGVGERGRGITKEDDKALCWVILIDNVLELSKMSKRATWKKILESEEDKKKIAETFERIDEHTKNFHLKLMPTH